MALLTTGPSQNHRNIHQKGCCLSILRMSCISNLFSQQVSQPCPSRSRTQAVLQNLDSSCIYILLYFQGCLLLAFFHIIPFTSPCLITYLLRNSKRFHDLFAQLKCPFPIPKNRAISSLRTPNWSWLGIKKEKGAVGGLVAV